MTAFAASLALAAALLHASWNALLRSGADRLWTVTVMSVSSTIIALGLILVLPLPDRASWPYIALSVFLQVGYSVFLAIAYQHGNLSQVYPVVRGLVPLLVTLGGSLVAHEHLSTISLIGIGLVAAGVIGLSRGRRRVPVTLLLYTLATSVMIACYVTVDAAGVRLATHSEAYTAWVLLLYGILLPITFCWMRGRLTIDVRSTQTWIALGGGFVAMVAYGLVVAALATGPAGSIVALRETSVVFAALIGRVFLREELTKRRIVACAAVACGAVCLA